MSIGGFDRVLDNVFLRTQIFKIDAHHQQRPLQHGRQHVHPPRTPPFLAQPGRQTRGPDQTSGRLDAHHRDTQTAHVSQAERRPDLREVLDRREDGGHDAQDIGPGLEMCRLSDGDDHGGDDQNHGVDDADDRHSDRDAVCRLFRLRRGLVFLVGYGLRGIDGGRGAGKVDEKEQKSV